MSADTTVVIAAHRFPGGNGELSYTAAVVQAVENLLEPDAESLECAKAIFLKSRGVQWFHGHGALSRAKQFANLLAQETNANGLLEYENRPIIEIGEDRVHLLSRKGKRKETPKPVDHNDWLKDAVSYR